MSRVTTKETLKLRITVPLWGKLTSREESTDDRWPSQGASNAESGSMPWRHHINRYSAQGNCKPTYWSLVRMYWFILFSLSLSRYRFIIDHVVRRAGLLLSQQDFEWRWSVPLFQCLTVLEFSFILFDLCLLITFVNFIMNYVPIVTFWIFTYHKIWILSIMFCFIWSYWIIYFLACL